MERKYLSVFARYIILVLIALPGFSLFYFIFSPLTIYPTAHILGIFYNVSVFKNIIFVNSFPIEIIGACVAGSAYYLLLILNLTIPNIKPLKRFKMILFAFISFFIVNLVRILILSVMYVSGSQVFELTHKLFWYFGSTVFILGIWLLEIKIFKIKAIPIYDDLKSLYKQSSLNKKRKKK